MPEQTFYTNLNAGDRDSTDSYIIVILDRREMAEFSKNMFNEIIDPYSEDNDFWRNLAQRIGSALWALYTESN